ncbi:hypothetical protein [Sagittula sp. SSi028]|uniref:hypothetical protein n=1 Tax=Sagittula sp. SSi028 TaxID=3400636 RepID=UPI003AF80A14
MWRVAKHGWAAAYALGCACLAGAIGLAAGSATAEEVRLSLSEARAASVTALQSGRPEHALTFAKGVLLGAPDDTTALFVRAQALNALGQPDAAIDTAQALWSVSDDATERYFAARLMGRLRSEVGQGTAAQLWLRRAAQLAPEDGLRAEAVQDFRDARAKTPWRFAIDAYAAPSDNLNNAPTEVQEVATGYVRVTAPVSGLRYGASVGARRTVQIDPVSRLQIGLLAMASDADPSDSGSKVDGAENLDFRRHAAGLTFGLDRRSRNADRLYRAQIGVYRHWHAAELLADVTRLDLGLEQALGDATLGLGIGAEAVRRHDSATGDADRRDAAVSLGHGFGPGQLALRLSVGETLSAASSVGRRDGRLSLSYGLRRPVVGVLPKLTLAYGVYNYDDPWGGTPDGPARKDRARRVDLDLLLPQFDYYGFAPEIGVSFEDRSSNYNLYESRTTDVRIGVKSIF